jgi:hypothetical protein
MLSDFIMSRRLFFLARFSTLSQVMLDLFSWTTGHGRCFMIVWSGIHEVTLLCRDRCANQYDFAFTGCSTELASLARNVSRFYMPTMIP